MSDLSLLRCGAPARLPEIIAVHFAPHLGRELSVEATVMAGVEVEVPVPADFLLNDHSRPLPQDGMARLSARFHVRRWAPMLRTAQPAEILARKQVLPLT